MQKIRPDEPRFTVWQALAFGVFGGIFFVVIIGLVNRYVFNDDVTVLGSILAGVLMFSVYTWTRLRESVHDADDE